MITVVYPLVGMVTSIAVLVGGVIYAYNDSRSPYSETFELVFYVFAALIGSVIAGVGWPLTWLIGIIVGGIKLVEHLRTRREEKALRRAAKESAKALAMQPLSDRDRYLKMAREQRVLANQARAEGMDDLAIMQENLASQYEQTANIYRS